MQCPSHRGFHSCLFGLKLKKVPSQIVLQFMDLHSTYTRLSSAFPNQHCTNVITCETQAWYWKTKNKRKNRNYNSVLPKLFWSNVTKVELVYMNKFLATRCLRSLEEEKKDSWHRTFCWIEWSFDYEISVLKAGFIELVYILLKM